MLSQLIAKDPILNAGSCFDSFKEGGEKGFNAFFMAYYRPLCYYANLYMKDLKVSEEIVNEGFVLLWMNREKIKSASHLKNYLYKVVYHLSLQSIQKSKSKNHTAVTYEIRETESMDRNGLDNMIRTELMTEIHQTINQLPEECKRIFNKLYLQGKTVREIATELGLSINTVKTQKRRALQFLRSKLSPLCTLVLLSAV
jgi:RNA polymerase sigma-70 factor (family 1)